MYPSKHDKIPGIKTNQHTCRVGIPRADTQHILDQKKLMTHPDSPLRKSIGRRRVCQPRPSRNRSASLRSRVEAAERVQQLQVVEVAAAA